MASKNVLKKFCRAPWGAAFFVRHFFGRQKHSSIQGNFLRKASSANRISTLGFHSALAFGLIIIGTVFSIPTTEAKANIRLGARYQFVSNVIDFTPTNSDFTLSYRPPEALYFGVIAGIGGLGGTLYFAIEPDDATKAREGESEFNDLGFTAYSKRFGFEFNYNRYKGFLVDNSSVLSAATRNNEQFLKLPNMVTEGMGITVQYALADNNFSLAAALDQSEVQESSGGSLLLVGSLRKQRTDNPTAILPAEVHSRYGADATLRAAKFTNASAGIIYAHNLVANPFFIAGYVGFAAGINQIDWRLENGSDGSNSDFALNLLSRLAFGLNSENYFATITGVLDRFSQETDSLELENIVIQITASAGLRF